jgi:hypothetical protein
MKKTSCKGSNYKYLGHFAQDKHLHRGHNTNDWVDASSPIDFKSLSKEQRREFQKQAMEKYGPKDQNVSRIRLRMAKP